jgi:hypothetical protein
MTPNVTLSRIASSERQAVVTRQRPVSRSNEQTPPTSCGPRRRPRWAPPDDATLYPLRSAGKCRSSLHPPYSERAPQLARRSGFIAQSAGYPESSLVFWEAEESLWRATPRPTGRRYPFGWPGGTPRETSRHPRRTVMLIPTRCDPDRTTNAHRHSATQASTEEPSATTHSD